MKINLLNKTAVCLLAVAFLTVNIYAAGTPASTPPKKTTTAKTTTKKSDLFGDDKDTNQIKGSVVTKADGTTSVKLTGCDAFPTAPPPAAPAATPPAQ